MDRITFNNGRSISSDYLNEIQKGNKFDGDTRTDYYANPTSPDEAGWEIGQRDGIKDWEIANPRVDPESAIGRGAHDGIVLGWDGTNVVVPGVPSTRPAGAGGIGVTVEAGTIISRYGNQLSWERQTVQILPGAGTVSYVYILDNNSDPVTLSISPELPSVTTAHVPLAKLTLNATGDGLATDPATLEVVGTGYVDLRPNTFVGNLNTYPYNLSNTDIQSVDYVASVWDRVIADTSGGSTIITLPESPNDSDRVAVVDISGTFDRFPVIIRTNPVSTELLNNSSDDWIVNIRDAHLELFYHADTGQWKFEEAPGSECNPVLGTFLSCGGREYIGDRMASECPDGALISANYPNPSPGIYDFEPSQSDPTLGKCYKIYNNSVALYANGTGGLINVANTPRCDRDNRSGVIETTRNTIYVDPTIGDDSIGNSGVDSDRPFRSLERALIEAVRESKRTGQSNDRYDRIMIELAPGDYYVDNAAGTLDTPSITASTGLIQRSSTNYVISSVQDGDRVKHLTINVGDVLSTQPPRSLNLGRILYSESGGVGNISRIEKQTVSGSNWTVTLEYVSGSFNQGDELYYDNLSVVNPQRGGLIVPRGVSIDGTDLRKVRVRPMYVPELAPVQNDPQLERTAILKVTGGSYISLITFTDNPQYARTHNTVTAVNFASQAEINGSGSETPYYTRLNGLFAEIDGWGAEGLEPIPAETTIVAPIATSKENRSQDIEENQTGLLAPGGDSRPGAPTSYPGATKIRDTDGAIVPLPDINSTRSSSPYVFNCSVRSIFGLNGLWAEGSRVAGFKSMVTANFTQVSLQTDPNYFAPTTYYQDPPTKKETGSGKQYKTCTTDTYKYRHFGMRGSNDATIQIVSVFVIGNSDHFLSESGSDLSITNSCSDFGDISLRSVGYKAKSFSQDEKSTSAGYKGTRITQIIPPLPLQYTPLDDGRPATLEDIEINTGMNIDFRKTKAYTFVNKTPDLKPPAIMRIYVENSNTASEYTLNNPPTSDTVAFGQYSYTRKIEDTEVWQLSGGPSRQIRKRIYVTGIDQLGNSLLYTGDLIQPNPTTNGFNKLDNRSKIFVWDPAPKTYNDEGQIVDGSGAWYIPVTTDNIVEETTDTPDPVSGSKDGYTLKKFDYAFRYLLNPSSAPNQAAIGFDYIFERTAIKIIRTQDKRKAEDRVYRVVLEGFKKGKGLRRPQPYYILEKQEGVAGYPLNGSNDLTADPLTVTLIRPYFDVFGSYKEDSTDDGAYVTYLTQGSEARTVFTEDFSPVRDRDYPELTEDPSNSITKIALELFKARPGVWLSSALSPSISPINLKTSQSVTTDGIRIGIRRPSVIRASNHTWEWTGYLNYDTAFPTFQGDPLEQDFALGKIIVEENGGRVYATGMNEEGNYYLGTTIFDLRSGEQYAIPLSAEGEPGNVTNQVLNNVIIKNTMQMGERSRLFFGDETEIFFSPDTEFKLTTTGNIQASAENSPAIYADKDRAGLVQLAKPEEVRGALNALSAGVSKKVVVTAFDLANELNIRFTNSVSGGQGVEVTQSSVEVPGGDENDPNDNIFQFSVNIGLPFNEQTVPFAGIRLGAVNGQDITKIVNSSLGVNFTDTAQILDTNIVTEKTLYNQFVNSVANQEISGLKTFNSTVTTLGHLVLGGAVANSGDIKSAGGDDKKFGIFNTANSGEILLIVKNSLGSDNATVAVTHGGATVDGTLTVRGNTTLGDSADTTTVNGTLNVTGDIAAFYSASDRNWKDNISPLTDSLSKVCAISGNRFDWNEKSDYSGTDVGLIAQEVREILPEAVAEREDGHLSVSYIKVIPLLVEAIKELKSEIESLKKSK